jgi:phospholipid-transporting ATPase
LICRAFFHVSSTGLFWALLLGIVIAALLPRLVVKFIYQYYFPSDIQISREAEKMRQYQRVAENGQIEMLPISDHQQHR